MIRLAGRCVCGVALELAATDQEAHLACAGLKRCSRCGEPKPFDAFFRNRTRGGTLFSRCKACEATRKRQRYNESPLIRARRLAEAARSYGRHKVARLTTRAAYYEANKEACRRAASDYRRRNRAAIRAAARAYYWANRDRILAQKLVYDRTRRTSPKRKPAEFKGGRAA